MTEQGDVVAVLEGTGILNGVRWAFRSATERLLETYREKDGHDATWFGNTRFTYFRDRLDRVFSCGRYAVPSGDGRSNRDVPYEKLSDEDRGTIPELDPGLVCGCDLNGSPGWVLGHRDVSGPEEHRLRFLLASCAFGEIDQMPWPRKSPTKQRVARQHDPDPAQPSLFDGFPQAELGGLESVLAVQGEQTDEIALDLRTFVVAHSADPATGRRELVFGRARLNSGGGPAWHWRHDLLRDLPAPRGHRADGPMPSNGPPTVPEAPVRLKNRADESRGGRANGER